MTSQKSSVGKKLIAFFFLVCVVGLIILGFIFVPKYFVLPNNNQTNQTGNVTNIYNINETNVTVIEPGKSNVMDVIKSVLVTLLICSLIGFLCFLLYKIISKKPLISNKNYQQCLLSALNGLREIGYDIAFEKPKQFYRYFGVDDGRNLGWAFVFIDRSVDQNQNIKTVPKFLLYSCIVDAKTLEVIDPDCGKDINDIKTELRDIRFGKRAPPKWAGKTEREATLYDLFPSAKPNINIGVQPDEGDEE